MKSLSLLEAEIWKLQKKWLRIYICVYIRSPFQYSKSRISGSAGPNGSILCQFLQNKNTTIWQSLGSIGPWEPILISMCILWKNTYILIYQCPGRLSCFDLLWVIWLRVVMFFCLPCGLARPLICIWVAGAKCDHFRMSSYRANKLLYYWINFDEFWFKNKAKPLV